MEKMWKRGNVWRKYLREGMLGESMEENVCFGENIGDGLFGEIWVRGYVWRKYMYWREGR